MPWWPWNWVKKRTWLLLYVMHSYNVCMQNVFRGKCLSGYHRCMVLPTIYKNILKKQLVLLKSHIYRCKFLWVYFCVLFLWDSGAQMMLRTKLTMAKAKTRSCLTPAVIMKFCWSIVQKGWYVNEMYSILSTRKWVEQ